MTDRVYIHVFRVGAARFIQYSEVQHLCEADTTRSEHVQQEIRA